MKQAIRKLILPFSVPLLVVTIPPSIVNAQDFQIDTKAIETPAKNPMAKKGQNTAGASHENKSGGPDRQFGELEGWSPGKEPPKDPKDPRSTTKQDPSNNGTRVSTTPSGNLGVGMGF